MPRRNPPGEIRERAEPNLARRIEYERAARGLSYEALAKAMTAAGCPIQGSALFRVEKGQRTVKVGELIALMKVFETDSVDDLLLPMEDVARRDALELFARLKSAQAELVSAIDEALQAAIEYLDLARRDGELEEFMQNQLEAALEGPASHAESVNRHTGTTGDTDPIGDAYRHLLEVILDFADQVVRQRG